MKKNKLFSYLFNDKKLMFGILLLIIFAGIFAQLTPYIQGLIVDKAIISQDEQALVLLSVIFVSILILDVFAKCYLSIIMTNLGYNIAGKIRKDVFSNSVNKPYDFFELQHNGDILQRTNYYVYDIGNYISKSVSDFAIGLTRFFIIFVFMLVLNLKLALILAGLYVFILLIIVIFSHYIFKLGKSYKKLELHRNSLILQNLEGMETYLAYNDNFEYLKNYKKVNKTYDKVRAKYYWLYNSFNPLIDFLVCLGTVLIYHMAFNSNVGIIEIGIVVAMLSYSSRMIAPMQMISAGLGKMFETKAVVDKVFALTDNNIPATQKIQIDYQKIDIRCENLCFKNETKAVQFKNLNLYVPFGQKLLIVGKYGLGKTAFLNILTGLYKAESGNVYFNEMNINKISKNSLNKMISFASDEVGIFKGTIYQNVAFGNRNANAKMIKDAIKKAGLMPLISTLPKKEHTEISENTISEGDKQLIAFARIILKNTPVIIVDEFSRDLDEKQKRKFFKNLEKISQGKTLIYISQVQNLPFKFTKKVYFSSLSD